MSAFCALPDVVDGPEWVITSEEVRARHAADARPVADWLAELDEVLDGADAVVAYNGGELDFPLLDEERQRAGLPRLAGIHLIDGLLVALTLLPNPARSHRLAMVAEHLSVDLEQYHWHDAYSDCRLLATVIWAGARRLARRRLGLVDALVACCDNSPAWSLLADLGHLHASAPAGPDEVADLLAEALDAEDVSRCSPRRHRFPRRSSGPKAGWTRTCWPRPSRRTGRAPGSAWPAGRRRRPWPTSANP